MPLREFSSDEGRRVRGADRRERPCSMRLNGLERRSMSDLPETAAFMFTREVQRSWCEQKVVNAAYLTFSVLSDATRRRIIDDWIDAGGDSSAFVEIDAQELLMFVAERLPNPSTELNVCRLEQAAIRASQHADTFQAPDPALLDLPKHVRRGRHAGLITALLVAPGLQFLHRMASSIEHLLWNRLKSPAQVEVLLREGYPRDVLKEMLGVGALEYAD